MKQYIVDCFTDKVFSGNPAAVCIMEKWISDEIMMNIARENNLSETAFTVKENSKYHLRWFTPAGEIYLCGHATLGSAFVILNYYEPHFQCVNFDTMGGKLTVSRQGELYEMDFPAYDYREIKITSEMESVFGASPSAAFLSRDLLIVFDSERTIREMIPDQRLMKKLLGLCVGVTAAGTEYDCVSRIFAPKHNVSEDPVTGSVHCLIAPFWAKKLGKNKLTAFQACCTARLSMIESSLQVMLCYILLRKSSVFKEVI